MTSNQVAEFAGVTVRQLQYWNDHNILRAEARGPRLAHRYSAEEAAAARIVGELRRKGIDFKTVRRALEVLKSARPEPEAKVLLLEMARCGQTVLREAASTIRLLDPAGVVAHAAELPTGVHLVEIKHPKSEQPKRRRSA